VPAGGSTRAFTYLHDLFPTLLDVAGIAQPLNLDGTSLRPLWEGRVDRLRDSLFVAYMRLHRAVRDARWKLIAYPALRYRQLFDLENDPLETTNVIGRAGNAAHVERLQRLMREWQTQSGDAVEIPADDRQPPAIDLTGESRTPDRWQPEWIVRKYFDTSANGESSTPR
jgi:arylsulfatase A-like enzyme